MKGINGYLSFNGNCREALLFYQQCLGGELSFQTVGDSPAAARMPDRMKDCILHGTLVSRKLVLMGTDLLGEEGLQKGNNISLMIQCSSEREIRSLYRKLSTRGRKTHQLDRSAWGALFGNLEDRYGNHWMLYFDTIKK